MKFKTIFFIFNAVILFSFILIFLMPFFILGADFSEVIWSKNWYIGLIFLVVISVIDTYFILNWELFQLSEKEDWKNLYIYLENKLFNKKKVTSQYIKIWINTCMVTSKIDGITRLEELVKEVKPAYLKKFAVLFGIPHMVMKKDDSSEDYFYHMATQDNVPEKEWILWCYAFILLVRKKVDTAKPVLKELLGMKLSPVVYLLSIYLLQSYKGEQDMEQLSKEERNFFVNRFHSREKWQAELEARREKSLLTVLLSQMVKDAEDWIYNEKVENNSL